VLHPAWIDVVCFSLVDLASLLSNVWHCRLYLSPLTRISVRKKRRETF
jgi:hypothetical protein